MQVSMSIWDLGGDRSYVSMMPMVCIDAAAMLFMFDLTQRSSLTGVREWYRQVRGLNKVRARPCMCLWQPRVYPANRATLPSCLLLGDTMFMLPAECAPLPGRHKV